MHPRVLTVSLLLLLAVPTTAPAQRKERLAGGHEYSLAVGVPEAEGMGFRLYLPEGWSAKSKKKYPVLLVLHGNGGAPERYLPVFRKLSTKQTPLILVAPGYQKDGPRDSASWPEAACNAAIRWIFEQATSQWHGDPDRLFLQGFSLGASGASLHVRSLAGEDAPVGLRGVVLNSGVAYTTGMSWPAGIPTLFVVGELETDVRGTNYVGILKKAANAVYRTGADARFHLMGGMGHAVNDDCLELIRRLIFEECAPADSPDAALATLKKRLQKNPRRMTDLLRLEREVAALPKGAQADRLHKALEQLAAQPLMASEFAAWKLLAEARAADRTDNPDRKQAYESLAKAHPKTEAGRLAADRLTWID